MSKVGSVIWEEAYALGKMLDHSAWQKGDRVLPRGITGSDLDAVFNRQAQGEFREVKSVFDNNGRAILMEFSSSNEVWPWLRRGQKWVYETMVQGGPHVAVLCRHNVKPEDKRPICSRLDVISFQPMIFDFGFVIGELVRGNDRWQNFVFHWFEDPLRVRRRILGLSAGMAWRPTLVPEP